MRAKALLMPLLLASWFAAAAHAGPKIESWHTDGGAKVLFVAAPELPMIDVRVVFDAGSARDDRHPGLARFTNAVMSEGAGDWDADALALRLEDRAIQLGNSSLRDMAWISVRSLTDPDVLGVAIDTTATVLSKPRFDEDAVERVRQQMQIALRTSLQSPGTIASRKLYRTLYGDHPYAHPPIGTADSLASISAEDLRTFHRRHYVSSNAVIAIVGAVDREKAGVIADALTRDLPRGEKPAALPAPPLSAGAQLRETFPSSQTHIYLGQVGMSRHDPDYFPLYVGNHALGGGSLVSILGEEVRNKRGLSYSVGSYFSPMRAEGPFLLVAQTKNERAQEAIEVMRGTLARFVTDGPSEQELEDAKRNLIGGFPLRIAGNGKIVGYLAMMGFYDYPLDWLDTLTDKLAAVDIEQVRDAFSRRIDPEGGIAVIVGGNG